MEFLKRHADILTLTLSSVALGIYCGWARSITLDEAVTLFWSFRIFTYDFFMITKEIHTPSYDILLGLWLSAFGFDLRYAKLFSALVAGAAVTLVYWLTKGIFGRRSAILAAALLAVSPLHVYYSQYARTYAFYIAASIFSSAGYLSLLRGNSKRKAATYVLATFLLISSHFVGFLLLLAQWIHYFALGRQHLRLKYWLVLQGCIATLYVPILFLILRVYELPEVIPQTYFWVPLPSWTDLVKGFAFISGAETLLTIIFGVLLVFGGIQALRKVEVRSDTIYLLLWMLTPPLVLFGYSHMHHPIFVERGFSSSAVPLLVLAAYALSALRQPTLRIMACTGIGVICGWTIERETFGIYEDWKLAAARVEAGPQKPLILLAPDYATMPFVYYYRPECFFSRAYDDCLRQNSIIPMHAGQDIPTGAQASWFLGYTVALQENQKILRSLQEHRKPLAPPESLRSLEIASFQGVTSP